MRTLINQAIIFLLFSCFISSSDNEIEILLNLLDCLEENENSNKSQIISLKNALYNFNPSTIIKAYDFLQDNIILLKECLENNKDIPRSIRMRISPLNKDLAKLDWMAYVNCLLSWGDNDKSLKYLLDLIFSKNYSEALEEERNLAINNNEKVILCSQKKNENVYEKNKMCFSQYMF